MSYELTPYPLDLSTLSKGDTLTAEQLEDAFGCARTDREYRFKLMALGLQIEEEFADGREETVTVTYPDDGIRILTDSEAVDYNPRMFRNGLRRAGKAHKRLAGVDRSQLNELEKARAEHELLVQNRLLQALKHARVELRSERSERRILGLDDDES